MRAGLAISVAMLLGACSRLPEVAIPGAGGRGTRALIADRVWLDQDPAAAPGSLMVFLSDGSLLMTSCGEAWRLAPWRLVEGSSLVWEEDGAILRADVALVGRDALALAVDLPDGGVRSRSFQAAMAPRLCSGD